MKTPKLDEWQAICDAAPKGRYSIGWRRAPAPGDGGMHLRDANGDLLAFVECPISGRLRTKPQRTFEFIATARTALPEAIGMIRERDAQIEALKELVPHSVLCDVVRYDYKIDVACNCTRF